jgi:DNA repair protein SbcD/Mre11
MRLLHTSDWHLGQDFYRHDRHFEHKSFLDWLIQVLESEAIDVLLVSGDIFDTSNPSAAAQRMFYDFIRRAHQHCKGLQTIVVAGNHDSPGRIEAPAQLLNEFNVTVVGRVSYEKQKCVSQLPFIVPLRRRNEEQMSAVCIALPFLRSADLQAELMGCTYSEGVIRVYKQALAQAKELYGNDIPLVAMGHMHASGGKTSEHSERRLVIGGEEAVALATLSDKFAYVALGHLHLAQSVAGEEHIRYCGSPLPLSFSEINYPHQVVKVDISTGSAVVQKIFIPRSVEMLRVPSKPQPLPVVLEELAQLSLKPLPFEQRPYLEVPVLRDRPLPELRSQLEENPKDVPVRLTRIVFSKQEQKERVESRTPLAGLESLRTINPVSVLERLHEKKFSQPITEQLRATFSEAVREVNSGVEL